MTVLQSLDFNADTSGSTPSWPSNWSTNGATPVAHTAAAAHGDNGCRWASTGSAGRVQYDTGSNQTAARVWSVYFNVRTLASANHYVQAIYSLTTGGSIQADWRINTNGTVTLRNYNTAIATSVPTISAGTWYRAEWRVSDASDSQELRIYVGESTTPHIALSGSFSSTAARVFAFGPNAAAAGGAIDYDTIKYADDWVGPEVGVPAAPSETTRSENACVITFNHVLDDITQTSGTSAVPTLITGSTYMFTRGTATRVYEVTYNAGSTSDPLTVTIPAIATGVTPQWPKQPDGALPSDDWL